MIDTRSETAPPAEHDTRTNKLTAISSTWQVSRQVYFTFPFNKSVSPKLDEGFRNVSSRYT